MNRLFRIRLRVNRLQNRTSLLSMSFESQSPNHPNFLFQAKLYVTNKEQSDYTFETFKSFFIKRIMADTTAQKVQAYKDSLKTKAEQLLLKGFPEKIVKLNELLETRDFYNRKLSDVHQDLNVPIPDPIVLNHSDDTHIAKKIKVENSRDETSGTKVMVLPNGPIPCNKPLCDLIRIVKPYIRQLLEDSNLLKMWVSYLIPKIEDGNNFGVSIQEDTLAEIQSVESEAAAFFDQISRYFISRGKIVGKVAKYPHISDYRRAVQEMDEKEYVSLWLVMCEIRNRYCSLHDLVIKNLEKIKKPRSSNAQSLY